MLQGNPEEVRELIDATPFAKKYTSGVLSFAEKELPPGGREKVMASFERVLMPVSKKNQYSILWVEHRDKGRLELNFLSFRTWSYRAENASSRTTTGQTGRELMPADAG